MILCAVFPNAPVGVLTVASVMAITPRRPRLARR
jgi:hypothetical protein